MTKILMPLAICCLMFTASCKEGWTSENKRQYKEGCMESAMSSFQDSAKAKSFCDCTMEKIEAKYPTISEYMEHATETVNDPEFIKCKTEAQQQK